MVDIIHNNGILSSVQLLSHVQLFATPWIAVRLASLSITNSWSSTRPTSIESVMPSSHLILCRPQNFLNKIRVGVQLQQLGYQPEGTSGVGMGWCSLWLKVRDYMFISSFRFSFILDKSIRSEIWHFQFILTQIYCLQKSLLPFKQSSCFSDSLRIRFTIYYLLPLMCPILVITL